MSPTETHIVPQTWNIIPFACFVIVKCDCVAALTTQNMIKSHEKNSNITTATSKGRFNKKYMQPMKRDSDFESKLFEKGVILYIITSFYIAYY